MRLCRVSCYGFRDAVVSAQSAVWAALSAEIVLSSYSKRKPCVTVCGTVSRDFHGDFILLTIHLRSPEPTATPEPAEPLRPALAAGRAWRGISPVRTLRPLPAPLCPVAVSSI